MQKPITLSIFLILFVAISCRQKPKGGPIQNTWWQLVAYTNGEKKVNLGKEQVITLHFDEENVNGKAPCNSFFANYRPDDVRLSFTNLAATERFCEAQDLENLFLDLLRQTTGYTANEKELTLLSDKGALHFRSLTEAEVQGFLESEKQERLLALFDTIGTPPPLHLYPIIDVDNTDDYPFSGQLIDTALYSVFESTSANVWFESGGRVYALGKYADFYLCRIPGRYVSSDIALYVFRNEKLQRAETVAWAWCDEGWCNQQDAWLQDLNRDGKIDIIQHYQLRDNTGKVKEERMTVLIQTENGQFEEDSTFSPDPELFQLAQL